MNEMMSQMMKQCCDEDGLPDIQKMKGFMQMCGKSEFSDDELAMLKEFCGQRSRPDAEKMMQLMEKCGC